MATTTVSTSSLMNVAKNVNESIAKYNKSIEHIFQIGAELDTMWDGSANQKFMAVLGADRDRLNAMSTLLLQYTDALNRAAKLYDEAEEGVKHIMTTNKVR